MTINRILVTFALAAALPALGQDGIDKLKVSFRDPSRPGTVKISLIRGSITVKGHSGQEVLVEATPRQGKDDDDESRGREAAGLKRIITPGTSLAVEEENNVMRIEVQAHRRAVDLTVQVPLKTSLNLHAINNGSITVEGVQGDIEVNNINGPVLLTNVAGSVVAHALNGSLTATIREVDGTKPMSFSSLNGKIDVTLPASLKANLNLQSARGEVYSDFDVVLGVTPPKIEETKREEGRARYRVSTGRGVVGKVNGGGQEVTFKNMNGSIYIRKGK
jgi:DUF4097 and DUF4098 domain-containing protein YvlB